MKTRLVTHISKLFQFEDKTKGGLGCIIWMFVTQRGNEEYRSLSVLEFNPRSTKKPFTARRQLSLNEKTAALGPAIREVTCHRLEAPLSLQKALEAQLTAKDKAAMVNARMEVAENQKQWS